MIKELIRHTEQSDVESMVFYSQILIEKGKLDKAFFYLNHCLKY